MISTLSPIFSAASFLKISITCSEPNAQNRAHFVRRYLKHAVSSEAVTVVFASMQSTTNWENNSSLGPRMMEN